MGNNDEVEANRRRTVSQSQNILPIDLILAKPEKRSRIFGKEIGN